MAAHAHVPNQGSPYGTSFCSNNSDPAKSGTHLLTTSNNPSGCGRYCCRRLLLQKRSIAAVTAVRGQAEAAALAYTTFTATPIIGVHGSAAGACSLQTHAQLVVP